MNLLHRLRFNLAFLLILSFQTYPASCTNSTTNNINATSNHFLIDDDNSHDPFKNFCQTREGEYYRDFSLQVVCCANHTLKLPDELVHEQYTNPQYAECSKQFKEDNNSDFPTGMWKAFQCKLEKSGVFKSKGKITFTEMLNFITKLYPEDVKKSLKAESSKCSAIDSDKIEDHQKIQKYMECFYEIENKVCDKPYANKEDKTEILQKTKQLGCPNVLGLGEFSTSIEYCCKKRSTPYPILEFPVREMELAPEAFQVSTPKTDDGQDHYMHPTWGTLCFSACVVEQRNYTKDMLKLDFDKAADFFVHDFGTSMQKSIKAILERRKAKDKIFLSMDIDSENSKPMTFAELKSKFDKSNEREKAQYFCKFVDTVAFEERRALHEYCFDEKYGNEWGELHHSFYVHHSGTV